MPDQHQMEIDQNYDFFQRNLASLLASNPGKFVLLRRREIVDFFSKPGDAYRAGLDLFPDSHFSIQEIRDEPIELGHLALDPR